MNVILKYTLSIGFLFMSIFMNPVFSKSLEPPLVEARSVFCLDSENVSKFEALYKAYGPRVLPAINQMQDLKCIWAGAKFSVLTEEEPIVMSDHKIRVFNVRLESGQEVKYLCYHSDKQSTCVGTGTDA